MLWPLGRVWTDDINRDGIPVYQRSAEISLEFHYSLYLFREAHLHLYTEVVHGQQFLCVYLKSYTLDACVPIRFDHIGSEDFSGVEVERQSGIFVRMEGFCSYFEHRKERGYKTDAAFETQEWESSQYFVHISRGGRMWTHG